MSNYLIILIGWIIGQITFTVISAYILQKNLEGINFTKSVKIFVEKEFGGYCIAIAGLFILMFIFNDYIDPNITRQDLLQKEVLSYKEKLILYSRTASVLFGMFCQFLILLAFKRGIKGIRDYAKKNELDDSTKP